MTKFPAKIAAATIKIYQYTLGIIFAGQCRYYPTCSEYTHQALVKHGLLKGLFMGIWRILRCNPWGKGGYDPVK